MPAKPTKPNSTTQAPSAYKAAIDAHGESTFRIGAAFAPSAQDTPNMTVRLEAGSIFGGTALTEVAAQSTGTITAPVTHPRIDRVVIDRATGAASVVAGTEAASPTAPAIPTGKLPVARVALTVGQTAIVNANITDERVGGGSGGTIDTDSSFAANSDLVVPSQKAVKAAIAGAYGNMPTWTTATRPSSPIAGQFGFNSTIENPEWWDAITGMWIKFSTSPSYSVSYLLVGGGGGAGLGGGGGGGGALTGTATLATGTAYPIVVGAGGSYHTKGNDTTGLGYTAAGGGRGGDESTGAASSGGAGGGGSYTYNTPGSGTSGQGFAGGAGVTVSNSPGGGGGGAGAAGSNGGGSASSAYGGAGGAGKSSSISGTASYYGGGGGGSSYLYGQGAGGPGGGGSAISQGGGTPNPGTANTGGGGGAGGSTGAAGGSGIVIISYVGAQRATGGVVTSVGGNTIHTFTASGTFTA